MIFNKHTNCVMMIAYDRIRNILFSSSWDGTIKIWNLNKMKCINTIKINDIMQKTTESLVRRAS